MFEDRSATVVAEANLKGGRAVKLDGSNYQTSGAKPHTVLKNDTVKGSLGNLASIGEVVDVEIGENVEKYDFLTGSTNGIFVVTGDEEIYACIAMEDKTYVSGGADNFVPALVVVAGFTPAGS